MFSVDICARGPAEEWRAAQRLRVLRRGQRGSRRHGLACEGNVSMCSGCSNYDLCCTAGLAKAKPKPRAPGFFERVLPGRNPRRNGVSRRSFRAILPVENLASHLSVLQDHGRGSLDFRMRRLLDARPLLRPYGRRPGARRGRVRTKQPARKPAATPSPSIWHLATRSDRL